MSQFFDFDPLTGITSYFDYDESTGDAYIRKEQDVSAVLRYAAELRNTGAADAKLKDDDYLCQYAIIPPVVMAELAKKGIHVGNADHTSAVIREINANYPWCKTTDKTIAR